MPSDNVPLGHRKRLREKFIRSGLKGFHDYEIIELLLSLGTPRKDCKQQAKEAIERFKTLRGVLEAPAKELQQINGIMLKAALLTILRPGSLSLILILQPLLYYDLPMPILTVLQKQKPIRLALRLATLETYLQ